jgi:uncharacterized protein YjiS (DUF1127 family)
MPDSILALVEPYRISELQLWLALAVVVAVVVLFLLFRKPLGNWRQERQIRRALNRLGAGSLSNISLPDGLGGEIVIDNLLLAIDAILVIDVKRFDGLIFGSSKTDMWTQVINKRSYRFPNPDRHLQAQVAAVRILVPGTSVRGLHLFTHNAKFPKGKPPNVLQLADIRKQPRRPRQKDIPGDLRTAWKEICASSS